MGLKAKSLVQTTLFPIHYSQRFHRFPWFETLEKCKLLLPAVIGKMKYKDLLCATEINSKYFFSFISWSILFLSTMQYDGMHWEWEDIFTMHLFKRNYNILIKNIFANEDEN